MLLALEDVRLRPANKISRFVAEAEMDIDTDAPRPVESDRLPAGVPHLVMQQFPLTGEDVGGTQAQQRRKEEDGEKVPLELSAAQEQKQSMSK